jgi:hypothetical protein
VLLLGGWIAAAKFRAIYGDFAAVAGIVLALAGSWRLTAADPSGLGERESGALRQATRILLLCGVLVVPLGTLKAWAATSPAMAGLVDVFAFSLGVAAIAGVFCLLRYMRRLAFRMYDPVLARRIAGLSYQVVAWTVGAAVTSSAMVAATKPIVPAGVAFLFSLRQFIFISALAIVPQLAYVGWRLGKALAAQARVARQSWPENDTACTDSEGGGAAAAP